MAQGSRLSEVVMAKIPGVRLVNIPGGKVIVVSTRGSNSRVGGACPVAVYINGVLDSDGDAGTIPFDLLGGVEYYTPGYVPIQYRMPGSRKSDGSSPGGSPACGVMLLWSAR